MEVKSCVKRKGNNSKFKSSCDSELQIGLFCFFLKLKIALATVPAAIVWSSQAVVGVLIQAILGKENVLRAAIKDL